MPKATESQLPLSGLFGVAKPSGPTSMAVINDLKKLVSASRLFMKETMAKENAGKLYTANDANPGLRVKPWKEKREAKLRKKRGLEKAAEAKMGQGGTLDPLADGVLVVGVNKGTKKLGEFLDCVKEYRTTCLLGCETDTYDSQGVRVRTAPWRHVTRESVEAALEKFRGSIQQTPPVFSALKMEGRPLYEYAREGIPLPRPIERRQVTVHSLKLTHWIPGSEHSYEFPEKKFTDEDREKMEKALRGVEIPADAAIKYEPEGGSGSGDPILAKDAKEKEKATDGPPAFVLKMRVSGGTYVRSVVHDLGHALGSAAHVVALTRSQQGRFILSSSTAKALSTPFLPDEQSTSSDDASVSSTDKADKDGLEEKEKEKFKCIPFEVFSRTLENRGTEKPDADGWREWEREVMQKLEVVETNEDKKK